MNMVLRGCVIRSGHEQAYENIHALYPTLDTVTLASKKFHTFTSFATVVSLHYNRYKNIVELAIVKISNLVKIVKISAD